MLSRFVGFFLFFLPFQFALNPSEGFDLPLARVLAVIIFLWWFARGLLRKSISLPPSLFTGAVLSFLFLSAASLLWATDTNFALRKLFFLLNFFPLIFVFYDLAEDQKVFQRWLSALVAGGTLAALISLALFGAQFIVGGEKIFFWLSQNALPFFLGENLGMAVAEYPSLLVNIGGETVLRATAFFPDPHVASFYFGITGFLALGIFLQKKKKLFLFAGLTLFLADALTFSRGGYLGFLMAGTAFLVFSWLNLKEKLQKSILIMGSVFIALFLFFGQPITTRFVSSFTLEDSSSSERLVLWETAFENIQKRPFFGAGLGNYILVVNPIAKYRLPYYAHNLYLDIATELGLSGLFFFILLIGVSYSYILKNVRMNHVDFVALGTLSALTLYLTHSLFETALYSVHILPLLLFILVLGYRKRKEYETQS